MLLETLGIEKVFFTHDYVSNFSLKSRGMHVNECRFFFYTEFSMKPQNYEWVENE
jgi:hypothetical protein